MRIQFKKKEKKYVLYVMRGLVACGKSFTAKRLAGVNGVIVAFDDYFYTEVGDDPTRYNYDEELLPLADKWTDDKFFKAIADKKTPVVLDQGNSTAYAAKRYVMHAIKAGYHVEIKEPESPWWRCIRRLLEDKTAHKRELSQWAYLLEKLSGDIHRVPYEKIYARMIKWESNITVEDIINS